MKYSVALSLALAPLALGKAIHNVFPVRNEAGRFDSRSSHSNSNSKGSSGSSLTSSNAAALEAALLAESGLVVGSSNEVIIIWVNGGAAASTTTLNQVQTVTQTVTAGAAAATATVAAAGTATEASGTTAVSSGAITTHSVTVGGAKGLVYEPDSITANIGDMVVFTFLSQNHTVTQSAFATPCEFLAGGMNSGFQPNINNSVSPAPQIAMQVMVSTPLWFYCAQKGHCGLGMVFSINPTANKTQALFQQMAIAQNGTGTGSAITGGTTSSSAVAVGTTAAAGASSVAAGSSSVAAGTSVATEAATASVPSSATAADSAATGIVTGVGSTNADGSCSCVVQCAVGAFPAVQAQGLGGFGGFSGSMPSSAVGLR